MASLPSAHFHPPPSRPRRRQITLALGMLLATLAHAQPAAWFASEPGVIDVTAPAYGADPTGINDSTPALKKAFAEAVRRSQLFPGKQLIPDVKPATGPGLHTWIYLPNGTYRVSDTLSLGDDPKRRGITLIGESLDGTILRLDDRCPGFTSSGSPKPVVVLFEGTSSNGAFDLYVRRLTIDVGAGNPGAIALDFHANNAGGVAQVNLRSSDPAGAGHTGLKITRQLGGISLLQDIAIDGFDTGVRTAHYKIALVFDRLTLSRQRVVGLENQGKPVVLRGLRSENTVPALRNTSAEGHLVVLDSQLYGGATTATAIENNAGHLFLRHVESAGYRHTLADQGQAFDDRTIAEYISAPALTAPGATAVNSLDLPWREAPEIDWTTPGDWVFVDTAPQDDDTDALQAALDSGRSTIVLRNGFYTVSRTLVPGPAVTHIFGGQARLVMTDAFGRTAQPLLHLTTASAPTVLLEEFVLSSLDTGLPSWFIQNDSPGEVVLRDLRYGGNEQAYRGNGGGQVFIEGIGHGYPSTVRRTPGFIFKDQTVWALHLNHEGSVPHVLNDGGTVTVLGFKLGERNGPYIWSVNAARTEFLGGLFNALDGAAVPPNRPFIVSDHSDTAVVGTDARGAPAAQPNPYLLHVYRLAGPVSLPTTVLPQRGSGNLFKKEVVMPLVVARDAAGSSVHGPVARLSALADSPLSASDAVPFTFAIDLDRPAPAGLSTTLTFGPLSEFATGELRGLPAAIAWNEGHTRLALAIPFTGTTNFVGYRLVQLQLTGGADHRVDSSSSLLDVPLEGRATDLARGLLFNYAGAGKSVGTEAIALRGTMTMQGGTLSSTDTNGWLQIGAELNATEKMTHFMFTAYRQRSISLRARPTDPGRDQVLFSQGGFYNGTGWRNTAGMAIILQGRRLIANVSGGAMALSASAPWPDDGAEHHVAFAFVEGRGFLYIDGVRVAEAAMPVTEITRNMSDGGFGGPARTSVGLGCFVGTLRDLRIYDRALNSHEVAGLARPIAATASAFTVWLYEHALTGYDAVDAAYADEDADGSPNLLEYALGGDPTTCDLAISTPEWDASTVPPTFRFFRAQEDVRYDVETSRDLLSWSPWISNPGTIQALVALPLPLTETVRFVRLRVSL